MKAPDIKINYPSGSRAIEIKGVDATIIEYLQLSSGMWSLVFEQLPKLQSLTNDFYDIYMRIKQVSS